MNKIFGIIAVTIIVLGSVLTSCYSPSERVENTLEYVRSVEKELEESKQHLKEIENYKMKASAQISSNEKSISEFQDKIAKENLRLWNWKPKILI
jgi:peptidoglycan hydrolase CwlO-like protein